MRWTGRMLLWTLTGLVATGAAGGCSASRKELYGPDDPLVRIPDMKRAVSQKDMRTVSGLVDRLESNDPAVRLFAIESLERLTGQRLGYLYYGSDDERAQAVQRWRRWLKGESIEEPPPPPASQPATQPSTAQQPVALLIAWADWFDLWERLRRRAPR